MRDEHMFVRSIPSLKVDVRCLSVLYFCVDITSLSPVKGSVCFSYSSRNIISVQLSEADQLLSFHFIS